MAYLILFVLGMVIGASAVHSGAWLQRKATALNPAPHTRDDSTHVFPRPTWPGNGSQL